MKEAKSSLILYYLYKYLFGCLIILTILGATEGVIKGELVSIADFQESIILVLIFLLAQIMASRYIFRVTLNRNVIRFNNKTIEWNNVESVNRIFHFYILKIKDKKDYYLFPIEKLPIKFLGDRIKDTLMDQIVNKNNR